MIRGLPLLALSAALLSCAHSVHQMHVSDFLEDQHGKKGRIIHAHQEEFTILGSTTVLDYVDLALGDFMRKCPEGLISGITTEYMTDLGFFSWTHHLYLTGQCIDLPSSHATKSQSNILKS
jgi:hypothetical protein